MDVEKLTKCASRRPVLYECNRKSYTCKDSAKKDQVWTEVAEELGEGVKGL